MVPVLIAVLRFLVVLFLIRLGLRLVASFVRSARSARQAGSGPLPRGDLVRDRVCNTYVLRERALLARIAGQEEHFCSTACRDRALGAAS